MEIKDLYSRFSFEPELINEIESSEIISIKSGTTILKEKQFIKVIPIVLEGSIKLRKIDENGREIIFYNIEPGESCILSITSCMNNKESQAEAIVNKNTSLIGVPSDILKKWMDNYAGWRKFVMSLYYDRLSELMTLVNHITFKSVDERLLHYLEDNAKNNIIEVTHQKLAAEIGTAREVISRLLKQMENDGLLKLERGKILII